MFDRRPARAHALRPRRILGGRSSRRRAASRCSSGLWSAPRRRPEPIGSASTSAAQLAGNPVLVKVAYVGRPSRRIPVDTAFAERSTNSAVGLTARATVIDDVAGTWRQAAGLYVCDDGVQSEACVPILDERTRSGRNRRRGGEAEDFFGADRLAVVAALAIVSAAVLPQDHRPTKAFLPSRHRRHAFGFSSASSSAMFMSSPCRRGRVARRVPALRDDHVGVVGDRRVHGPLSRCERRIRMEGLARVEALKEW